MCRNDLDRALLSLSLGKVLGGCATPVVTRFVLQLKILTKTPKDKQINAGKDVFGFNESFAAPHTKLKIQVYSDLIPSSNSLCDSPANSTDVLPVGACIQPKNALHLQASKSSAGERDTVPTRNAIMEDRKHEVRHSILRKMNDRCVCQIDAAIVRIMKARKELPVCTTLMVCAFNANRVYSIIN